MATVVKLKEYGESIAILFSDGSQLVCTATISNVFQVPTNDNGVKNIQTYGNQLAIVFEDGRIVLAYPMGGSLWAVGPHPDYNEPPDDLWYWPFAPNTWNMNNGFPGDNFRTAERPNHNGMDMGYGVANITDYPIKMVHSGLVLFSGFDDGYGNRIQVLHNSQFSTTYNHMDDPSPLSAGPTVYPAGTVVGGIGNTGNSFGNHLHFEVYDHFLGDYVDPLIFMSIHNPTNAVI